MAVTVALACVTGLKWKVTVGAAVVLLSRSKLERIRVVPGGDKHSVQVLLSPSALQNTCHRSQVILKLTTHVSCYGSKLKCLLQTHDIVGWPPGGSAVLGGRVPLNGGV